MTIKQTGNTGFDILRSNLSHWEESEDNIKTKLERLGFSVTDTNKTAIHDFLIERNWITYSVELKTRNCERLTYQDSMIGANKLAEAWQKWYKDWIETLFLFQYTDGLYYVAPLKWETPRKDYKAWRFDRGKIDWKKGWIYYKTAELINITKLIWEKNI